MDTTHNSYYMIFSEETIVEEEVRITYGIKLRQQGEITAQISDISPDRDAVEALAQSFNDGALAAVHFRDAVEDFLP